MSSFRDGLVLIPPSVTLPKGGGAIRGIGEKFAANPVVGTASLMIPLITSPGRSGFAPQLAVSYDSGSGNGPFGFGWSLQLPAISRKTEKGLPLYHDVEESDVFVLSGAEDLVPLLDAAGERIADRVTAPGYVIHRYRPRIEGSFARIERWTQTGTGDVHWRSIARDNVLTVYGKDSGSRVADPLEPTHVFSWLISESRDDKGNGILYEYRAEDGIGVDLTQVHERNRGARNDPRRTANRYLKRVTYGNRRPFLDANTQRRPRVLATPEIAQADWMFEVVLDYGEHDDAVPKPRDAGNWTHRADAFSSYRAGFEVRTSRLCRRVLTFHHFVAEADVGADCLVRSTELRYSHEDDPASVDNPIYTFLRSATQSGYRRQGAGYLKRHLPPVEFEYTRAVVQSTVETVDPDSLANIPMGLDGRTYRFTDLHGEGIPGIFTEQGDAWFYKRNLSPISEQPVQFAPVELVATKPSFGLADGRAQLIDLAGDGQLDVVMFDGPTPGVQKHDEAEGWERHRAFTSYVERDTSNPNLRFIDLDGDGRADLLVSEDDAFVWYPSHGEDGFGPGRRVLHALDEEAGPRLVFSDGTESLYLADLTGADGLTDLVRVRNGEVCYWPNLGYGRFGAKVTMDGAPVFDDPDQFEQQRIRLADIDGSGTADLVYLHRDGVHLYFNRCGNGWSPRQALPVFPRVDDLADIVTLDLLGNGTACLVWSSPLPENAGRQLRYVNLMGGKKPHLLSAIANNLGTESRIAYAPSTAFYLRDKQAGRPWITKLPFPVHVVERVETLDRISGTRYETRYAYHHGYFDADEREFRGFGMVEQWDTDEFAAVAGAGAPAEATAGGVAWRAPRVLTKTWFNTGAFLGRDHVAAEPLLVDSVPAGLSAADEREARRTLKGTMQRREVYAIDGTDKAAKPYLVSEQSSTVRVIQPRRGNRHAICFAHARESLTHNYEREPTDPRTTHALTLEVDGYGTPLQALAVAYGRKASPLPAQRDRDEQTTGLITYTDNRPTTAIDDLALHPDDYRAAVAAETLTWQLTGFAPEQAGRFSVEEWTRNGFARLGAAAPIAYETPGDGLAEEKRLIEHVRLRHRRDDLTALLPLGGLEPLGLPGESYKLALTPGLLASVFVRRAALGADEDLLPAPAGMLQGVASDAGAYVAMDSGWWVPSGRAFFDPAADAGNPAATAPIELATARQHFFLTRKVVDAFGHATEVDYDAHDLLVARSANAIGNTTTATNDYRVLMPGLVTDANANCTAVAFDALGMVIAVAVMGKADSGDGDLLEGVDPDPPLPALQQFIADPIAAAPALLGSATTRIVYDCERYRRSGQPLYAATVARETHVADEHGTPTRIQIGVSYSDGLGREIQKKARVEAGDAPRRQAAIVLPSNDVQPGDLMRDAGGALAIGNVVRRWVGSGRTVLNNKGKPVMQYEPFFSATHHYEGEREMAETGVSPVLFYDPVERLVATLLPNHTYSKVVIDNWRQTTYDTNDTVAPRATQTGDPRTDDDIGGYVAGYFAAHGAGWTTWHAQRIGDALGAAERDAAEKAAVHADTPSVSHLDALGRVFLTILHNRYEKGDVIVEEQLASRVARDVEGNQRVLMDAHDRVAARQDYDMIGTCLHVESMDAGERWHLFDAAGKVIRAWDSRGFRRRMTYDELRRPTGVFVSENGGERLAERTVYGEALGDALNHRSRVHQVFDGAGVLTSVAYDFKGNLRESRRDLLADYRNPVNWLLNPAAEDGSATGRTNYDALSRPTSAITPDGSVYRPTFNEGNLLESVDVQLRGAEAATPFVTDIGYDAKGQRTRIAYGNGAVTTYNHDPLTFRLRRLRTTRLAGADAVATQLFGDPTVIQDLGYAYDPNGNVTRIADAALPTVFHAGEQVEPLFAYRYDALYRLIEAKGREHTAQSAVDLAPGDGNYRDHPFAGHRVHPNDLTALRKYTQSFEIDAAGNFTKVRHVATDGSWTRTFDYQESSLCEPARQSNRLTRSTLGNGGDHVALYVHDAHGNITAMPHLNGMTWDDADQLTRVDLAGGRTAYYVYGASGGRVRRVIESAAGVREAERLYFTAVEVYREFGLGGALRLRRESLHVMDDVRRIALVETTTTDGGVNVASPVPLLRYQLGNHIGSASLELAADGAVISYEEYHPYGTSAFQGGRSGAEVERKRYRYTGKERDDETGFSYHSARYYAPWLGRWTAADPSGTSNGLNLYEYAHDSPVSVFDPNGREGFWSNAWEVTKGVGEGIVDFGAGVGHAVAHPIDTVGAIGSKMAKEFHDDGGGFGGVISAINVVNPAYHAMVAGYETYQAVEAGNYKKAGKQGFNTVLQTVSTVLVATGAAGAISGGISGGGAAATTVTVPAPALVPTLSGTAALGWGTAVVAIPGRLVAVAPGVAIAGGGVMMSVAGGKPPNPPTGGGGGGSGSGSPPSQKPAAPKPPPKPKPAAGAGATGGGAAVAAAARPTLLQRALSAGAREVIEEGPIEVYAHGTTAAQVEAFVETQGANLSAEAGNFGGKFFTVPSEAVAESFAARTASKVAGSEPGVVGVALPRAIANQLKQQGLLKLSPIENPPPGVLPSAQQWVFSPGAFEFLKQHGVFFKLQ